MDITEQKWSFYFVTILAWLSQFAIERHKWWDRHKWWETEYSQKIIESAWCQTIAVWVNTEAQVQGSTHRLQMNSSIIWWICNVCQTGIALLRDSSDLVAKVPTSCSSPFDCEGNSYFRNSMAKAILETARTTEEEWRHNGFSDCLHSSHYFEWCSCNSLKKLTIMIKGCK